MNFTFGYHNLTEMEEELNCATNKYARVKIIRKYKNRVYINKDDCVIIFDKRYDIGIGTYVRDCFTKTVCYTCSINCQFLKIALCLRDSVVYNRCIYCHYKNIEICGDCYMPRNICTKTKITTVLILKKHLHRDIIPIILNKIHN